MASPDSQNETLEEEILRASRPRPRPEFVVELGRELFPPSARPRRPMFAFRPAFAGAVLALSICVALVVFSLAGAGPLGGGHDAVRAKDNCRTTLQTRTIREPVLRVTRDGRPTLSYRDRVVKRPLTKCG